MNKYMKVAIEEAKIGIEKGHGGPFGSVVVKNGIIVGRGHNMVVGKKNPILHGEIVAIQDACKNLNTFDLSGCEIYTTSEPCPMCLGAVLWANIDKIYYGCTDADADAIGFRDESFFDRFLELKQSMAEEIDRKECFKVFKDYQKKTNKKTY